MRWPWQPRPGMVRLSHRELIRLQGQALKAAELEREVGILEATNRARQLLLTMPTRETAEVEVRAETLEDVPVTLDGQLHEPALLALYQARIWERRERELATLMATNGGAQ